MSQSYKLQAPLVAGFFLLLAIAASSVWLYFSANRLNEDVSRSSQVRSAGNLLLILTQDAETGQRGFLLTHNRDYLAPYNKGAAAVPLALTNLKNITARSPAETLIVARLRQLVGAKLAELSSTLVPATKGDFAGALAIVNNNTGNNFMNDIRTDVGKLDLEEQRSRDLALTSANKTNIILAVLVSVSVILIIVLALYAIRTTQRSTDGLIRAQHDLADVNRNLEGTVEARVGDLRLANEEIQRFAYIVSHDLRAPLVNVLGFTSELDAVRGDLKEFLVEVEARAPELVTSQRRELIETDVPEALGFIRASTNKMDRLINAILKLSREGRRTLRPEKIALAALVKAQSESLSQQLASKQAELSVEDDLPDLVSDRLAIEQIFGNLIENAVKYLAPDRAGTVLIKGRKEGAFLYYQIADNGRGIATKDRERIFELFRRSGEQDTQGEGIGLAYVRNLVRRLGGGVAVESEFGVGSTFTVTLPAVFTARATADF